jgi:hypothetical protein
MLAGLEDEMEDAEEILMTTMGDWDEKVNKGKTEKLRMTGGRRAPYDVRREFEAEVVRHLGAMHREDGDRCADTGKRISVAHALVRAIAKGWSIGTSHGRGRESGIDIPTRLQVLESCVMGALLFGCRTRGWTGYEVTKMQRVANYAVRRAFGMDTILMEELGLSDASMVKAAQWRTVEDRISRLSLSWLGHVARMPVWRHPKQVLFGFIEGRGGSEERNLRAWHTRWLRTRIRKLHTHEMDWFRIACNRKAWRRAVDKAYPATGTTSERRRELRRWRPGQPLPGGEAEVPPPPPPQAQGERYKCPVCGEIFDMGHSLQNHYDSIHAVRDPSFVTIKSHKCDDCGQYFAFHVRQKYRTVCPARLENRRALETYDGQWLEVVQGPIPRPPDAWWIATDGSGKDAMAGWGAVIFRYESPSGIGEVPEFVPHAPVVVQQWDHRWLGARDETNNTAELTAIGEVMHWLLEEAPDHGSAPVHLRYDSI